MGAFCEFCKFYLKISGAVLQFTSTLLILSFYCSAAALTLSPDDEAPRNVAFQWLQVVDSGKYRDATLLIAEHARGSQDWLNYFAAHRTPLGQVKNRQVVEVKHASTIPGDPELRQHDIIRFKTSFEHKPGALEEVVMTKMGCCWEVSGYKIFRSDPDGR